MNYYLIAPLGRNLASLSYKSSITLSPLSICEIPLKNAKAKGVVIKQIQKPEYECKEAQPLNFTFTHIQEILSNFISQYYFVNLGEAYELCVPKNLENKSTFKDSQAKALRLNQLSKKQLDSLNFIESKSTALLFGDTGSGKTEIYIHAIAKMLNQGKQALFLMPEIALTPQIEKRLKHAFGDMIGIWHSKVTSKTKQKLLCDIASGKTKIIAGARSALFLPLEHLGLIIIDEEHDDAYKSSKKPFYNARDLALFLGKKCGIKVILGSATPSLSSYFNALKHNYLYRLKGQFHNASKQFIFESSNEVLTSNIKESIKQILSLKEQGMIFVPTRANYKMLVCQNCGSGVKCEFCDSNMSLHLHKNILLCHYCNFAKSIPSSCPNCQMHNLQAKRIGTQQVADELRNAYPEAKIEIFDRDNITTQKKLTSILQAFNDKEIDLLVGTQMISKGHDYHSVNLSVILGIDYVLNSSDYRCNELALSLVYQIAGRSGRKNQAKVIIQSYRANFLRQFLDDYEHFLQYELQMRPRIYPPFVKMCVIRFSHKSEAKILDSIKITMEILQNKKSQSLEIVGFSKAKVQKISSKFRYVLLVRSQSVKILLESMHYFNANAPKDIKHIYEIDMDPLSVI